MAWVVTGSRVRDADRERAQLETWLGDCEEAAQVDPSRGGTPFSDWEREFLESIRQQFDERGSLSERQAEILKGLWDRV